MGERGRNRRRLEERDKARRQEGAKARRAAADGITVQPHLIRTVEWREFESFDEHAVEWIRTGDRAALTPGILDKLSGGLSMYVHARDPELFAVAARSVGAHPLSVPEGRTGANVSGEFLMRAIIRCRADRGAPLTEFEMLKCPACGGRFFAVAAHRFGVAGESTTATCTAGHRWNV